MANVQTIQTEDVIQAYREMASYPSASSARISNSAGSENVLNISTVWSQRDIERKEKTTFGKTYIVNKSKGTVLSVSAPQEINNQLWDVESPSGKYRAVIRKQKDKKDEDKQYIEIWSAKQKLKTIDVQALEKHGDIVGNDGQFGSVRWSQSEGHLLYVAEKKKPKTSSFFTNKPPTSDGDSKVEEAAAKGDEFVYRETWGEQLNERHVTVLCVMDVEAGTVSILETVPEDVSPGQAIWGPDDAGVVFVGWSHEPYRLGLRFCVERPSFVYYLDFQTNHLEKLSGVDRAVRCPYLSPDQKRLVFLDTPVGGPHNQCSRVLMCEWENRKAEPRVVVDVVNSAGEGEFPGVFTWAVLGTSQVWLSDNVHIVLPTFWRSQAAVVVVNTQSGQITRLQSDKLGMATSLLDVSGNTVVLSCSSPNRPFYLVYGTLKPSNLSGSSYVLLDSDTEKVENIECRIIRHVPTEDRKHPKYGNIDYESLLYLPKTSEGSGKPPLILFPHGGPHSAYDSSFILNPAVFCRCGFAALLVNFRGSIGFGQDSIMSLLERVGDQDVKDCKSAVDEVIAQGFVDKGKVVVCGGSHGGFLTAHLIGQYPDFFKAASTRNPVINLTSRIWASDKPDNKSCNFGQIWTGDIPDKVFTETGLTFSYDSLADASLLTKLWNASPIRYVDQVKTPVMLQVGLKDLRVPPSQSMEYRKALKARGVPVRCLTYPTSNHGLSEVEVEADCLVNTILWFSQHLKGTA